MKSREAERYTFDVNDVYFEFSSEDSIKGKPVNISLKGIGFEINNINHDQVNKIRNSNDLFIKLFFGKEYLLLGVKNIWNTVIYENKEFIFKGGLQIHIISPSDKLILSDFIEKLRDTGF